MDGGLGTNRRERTSQLTFAGCGMVQLKVSSYATFRNSTFRPCPAGRPAYASRVMFDS